MQPLQGQEQIESQVPIINFQAVRASTALASLWHAVEICAINSLEAGATEVHVEVDAANCSFKVVDNGTGLPPSDLQRLGIWNSTSKTDADVQRGGARGVGLAAICSTAVVEVTSRAAGSFETHSCLLRAGELLQLKLAPEQKSRSGTTISVRDMFFNRPVAQKSLALHNGGHRKEVEKCREVISGLALLRPSATFTLYDRSSRAFLAKYIKGRSQLQCIAEFFGQNRPELLVQISQDDQMCSSGGKAGWTKISGWALPPPFGHPTASRQRIFINNRAVKASQLAKPIDEIFSELYATIIKQQQMQQKHRNGAGELLTVRKASNLHPMFVLDLQCPAELLEILPEPGGGTVLVEDWEPLVQQLRQAVLAGWNSVINSNLLSEVEAAAHHRHHQLDSRSSFNGNAGALWPGGSSSAPGRLKGLSSGGSRSGSAAAASQRRPSSSAAIRLPPQGLESGRTYSNGPRVSQISKPPPLVPLVQSQPPPDASPSLLTSWRHRRALSRPLFASGISTAAAAGSALPPQKRLRSAAPIPKGLAHQQSVTQQQTPKSSPFSALDAILSTWKNPAMMPAAASGTAESILTLEGLSSATFSQLRPAAVQREDLFNARALRQVDCKFIPIVCKNGVLAVVDQHAADERVQLEYLKAQVVAPSGGPAGGACASMQLPTPQPLRLGADEAPLLEAFAASAVAWGWRWKSYKASPSAPEMLVEVTAVPLVANRALTATDLRLYLHDLAESRRTVGTPAGVTRLLNSKACRTAVMFGDELVPSECQNIIDNLQETQLCFICAHGRPTTAPLLDLKLVSKAAEVLQAGRRGKNEAKMGGKGAEDGGLKEKLLRALQT